MVLKQVPLQIQDKNPCPASRYDYIVIGAGSSGCIVASNLAKEFSDKQILLLEAGPSIPGTSSVIWDPRQWALVSEDQNLEWGYKSTKQEHLNGRIIDIGRAKGLGGCSIHNAMVYVRGGKKGFDNWKAEGNTGWDYDSVLPYFRKVEDVMSVQISEVDEFMESLIEACKNEGIEYNPNYNESTDQVCISPFQYNIRNDKRETTYSAFLQGNIPTNLCIKTEYLVEKIDINKSKAATGVVLRGRGTAGSTTKILATTEIILCASAIGSPHILMLSGVGPNKELKKVGIETIVDLPGVGQNLQDDLFVTARFKNNKTMPYQPYSLMGVVIFANTPKHDNQLGTDIECSFAAGTMPYMKLPPEEQQDWFIYPNIQLMKSRGTVTLASDSIFHPPIIDPKYLSDKEDMEKCVSALEKVISIGMNEALSEWVTCMVEPPSTSNLKEYIRQTADTTYHYAGTCKMGPKADKMAVVGPDLKVHGVSNLRVIDSSIIPTTVSGNTAAATMMIAEKGSDMVIKSK